MTSNKELTLKKLVAQFETDKGSHAKTNTNYAELRKKNAISRAVLDEIGELNHELKYNWNWWKLTQSKPDKERILDELADVEHFLLSYVIATHDGSLEKAAQTIEKDWFEFHSNLDFADYSNTNFMDDAIFILDNVNTLPHQRFSQTALMDNGRSVHCSVAALLTFYEMAKNLGFTYEELTDAYFKKSHENHERNVKGY